MTMTTVQMRAKTATSSAARIRNVLIIKGAYEPHGGTESVLSGFLDLLDPTRYRPHLVMLSKPNAPQVPPLAKDPSKVRQSTISWGRLRTLDAIRELTEVADAEQIDIIHSHDSRSTVAAWLLAKRRPVVWVAHMHGFLGRTGVLKNQFVEAIAKRLQRRADLVIGGSEHTCSEVRGLGMKKLRVLPNGIRIPDIASLQHERRCLREAYGIADDTVWIGVTSRLHPGKGHRYLFPAVSELARRGLPVRLLVIGDGDHGPVLMEQVRNLGLEHFVQFTGRVPEVLPYLTALDVFCLPSLKESLSIAVLEAMAAGLPVVTTRVGDFEQLIAQGENGFLVPPEETSPLTDALAALVASSALRTRLGVAGRCTVQERYSLETMVRTLEHYYDEAFAANTPKTRAGR